MGTTSGRSGPGGSRSSIGPGPACLPGIRATFEVRVASSIPAGLLDVAADVDASALVLGSSSKGPLGRISFGSVTDRLVHSAPLPVLLAPRGYRPAPNSHIHRVSIGLGGSAGVAHVAAVGAKVARGSGCESASRVVCRPASRAVLRQR